MTGTDSGAELARLRSRLPQPRDRSDAFSVESFLAGCVRLEDILSVENRSRLAILRRKVEVSRKLAVYYERDLRKPLSDEAADPQYALLLCGLYLAIADRTGELVSLNAALKMMDGILLAPTVPADAGLDKWADQILARTGFPHA